MLNKTLMTDLCWIDLLFVTQIIVTILYTEVVLPCLWIQTEFLCMNRATNTFPSLLCSGFRELREGALPEEEMDSHPLLKKYSPGEPTHRLYVKNLAKQTTSDQLKYIFGR